MLLVLQSWLVLTAALLSVLAVVAGLQGVARRRGTSKRGIEVPVPAVGRPQLQLVR